jgi:hypothetical protein
VFIWLVIGWALFLLSSFFLGCWLAFHFLLKKNKRKNICERLGLQVNDNYILCGHFS